MKKILFILFLSALMVNCERITEPVNDNTPNLRVLTPAEKQVISSTNDFAFNLLNHLNNTEKDNNFFVSPLSVAYALAMTSNGAAGSTRGSILHAMSFDTMSTEDMNSSFKSLTDFLYSLDNKTNINVANSIWYEQTLNTQPRFDSLIQEYYNGKIQGLDFKDQGSKDIVNKWIEDETNGKIKNMINKIQDGTVMYLVNAVYFKSQWTYRFNKNKTKKDDFYLESGEKIQVDMMESAGVKMKFFQDGNVLLADIPYGNEQFALSIIIPEGSNNLNDLANSLTSEQYADWMKRADTTTLPFFMPKFSLEYKTDLKDQLYKMGMGIAFSDGADLSNLFVEKLPLEISQVLHKARIDVDEEGSEAAAATVVGATTTSYPPQPHKLMINSPFLFFIHERYSNTILFYGKMLNPTITQ